MPAAAKHEVVTHPIAVPVGEPNGARRPFLKVYLPAEEKAAFAAEAARHRQDASEYARFILGARSDPLLFLQLARLLHPGFAAGLMGNPADAGRAAELEKQVLTLTHEREDATRDRDEAEKRAAKLDQELAEAREAQRKLAAYVVDLAKAEAHNRARAMQAGEEVEAVPRAQLLIVGALAATPAMTCKELEDHLKGGGLSEAEAGEAVVATERLDIIVKGRDRRYRLAKQPVEAEEE